MNWIRLNKALEECKKFNVNVTRQGLIKAGYQNGFIEKDDDGYHYIVNYIQLLTYISTFKELPNIKPNGEEEEEKWITVKEASKILRVCVSTIYNMIDKNKLEYKVVGRNKIKYVKENIIKNMIEGINIRKMITVKQIMNKFNISFSMVHYYVRKKKLYPIKKKGDCKFYFYKKEVNEFFKNKEKEKMK